MCGRYQITRLRQWAEKAGRHLRMATTPALPTGVEDRYNVAPQQELPVLVGGEDGPRFEVLRWGLVPPWAVEGDPARKGKSAGIINARAETVADKPAFRDAYRRGRCLVPADAFYEWKKPADGGRKRPYRLGFSDGEHFAFAGLRSGDTFAFLTTRPNDLAARVHDRMPVMLAPEQWPTWLDAEADLDELARLAEPAAADEMVAVPVGTGVNRPANEGPHLAEAVGPPLGDDDADDDADDDDGQPGLFD